MNADDVMGLTSSEVRSRLRDRIVGALNGIEIPAYAVEPVTKDYGSANDETTDQLIVIYGDEIWLASINRAEVKAS